MNARQDLKFITPSTHSLMRLSTICHVQVFILFIAFAGVAFASWPFSSSTGARTFSDSFPNADVYHCQDAREVIEDYCSNPESRRDAKVVESLMNCFMNEAGRGAAWKSGSDVHQNEGIELAIQDGALKFVDELCEDSLNNHVSDILKWFNGDVDMARIVKSLQEAVEQVSLGTQRALNSQQSIQAISRTMEYSIRGLRGVKSAFSKASSSLFPDEGDTERLYDELWIKMQDVVETFNSYTAPISQASKNFKNLATEMESFEKVASEVKSIAGSSWSKSKELIEELVAETKKSKGLRSRILHPWLNKGDGNSSPENGIQLANVIVKPKQSNPPLARASYKHFGFSMKWILMRLYDGVEMLSTAYLRFAFSKLVLHVIASPSSLMWLVLIFTGASHILGGVLVLANICMKTGELISMVLGLVTMWVRDLCSSKMARANHLQSVEKENVEGLKESLSEDMEGIRAQRVVESLSEREINALLTRLLSQKVRLQKTTHELTELNEKLKALPVCE